MVENEKRPERDAPVWERLRESVPDPVIYYQLDPDGLDAHDPGAKLDAGKPLAGCLLDVSRALEAVVDVFTYGAGKYSRGGWQRVDRGVERYTDAMLRHLLQEGRSVYDAESGLRHAAQVAWNALTRLELMLREEDPARETLSAECLNLHDAKHASGT